MQRGPEQSRAVISYTQRGWCCSCSGPKT